MREAIEVRQQGIEYQTRAISDPEYIVASVIPGVNRFWEPSYWAEEVAGKDGHHCSDFVVEEVQAGVGHSLDD